MSKIKYSKKLLKLSQSLVCSLYLIFKKQTLVIFKVDSQPKKIKICLFSSFLKMIIGKNLGWSIFSFLIYHCFAISSLIETRREIEIIIKAFNQGVKMRRPLLLSSTLLISKNKISNLRNNQILARLNIITIKKQITILVSLLIKSQKTSFNLGNFLVNNCS